MKKAEYYKDKETQGHKKMLQYIDDLKRNKHFLKKWRQYRKLSKSYFDDDFGNGFELLIKKYTELNKITKKFLKKHSKSFEKMTEKMAEEYGLDMNLIGFVYWSMDKKLSEHNYYEDYLDMCVYNDYNDKYLAWDYLDLPLIFDQARKKHLIAYPVSIDIHKYATKRDVLDFIEKRWERIYTNNLSGYTNKKVRFRKRKQNRELVDFIWNNKQLKAKEIKKLLGIKFPENTLAYFEINKLVSIEKQRRLT